MLLGDQKRTMIGDGRSVNQIAFSTKATRGIPLGKISPVWFGFDDFADTCELILALAGAQYFLR